MNYWDSVGRWINTLLVFIVGVLAFDALFRLLEANEDNVIVAVVRVLSVVFLVPFQGMFGDQDYVLTTLVGVLGYALLAGIALGVLRSLQASLSQPAPPVRPEPPDERVTDVEPVVDQEGSDRPQAVTSDGDGTSRRSRRANRRGRAARRDASDADVRPAQADEARGNGSDSGTTGSRLARGSTPEQPRRATSLRGRAAARRGASGASDTDA
ncbi:MAG TPA: hypothetical protein VFZ70_18370 [Euzebyales bacterium]